MATTEHTLSFMLRNSGVVLAEAELSDVVLHRRDGEDLLLASASRARMLKESLNVAARALRAALHDRAGAEAAGRWLAQELPWTHFLPDQERSEFLGEFAASAAACADTGIYEPMLALLGDWKATAEVYADPRMKALLDAPNKGPVATISRPKND